ncbi:MAG: 2OG-Fe(II) oxygenase [Halieaceae bacterium]|jgi:prolyl 4-hydroxylase|nr:2OG-Fe(II) oxygenase [Halieaceae bacterium]
MNLDNEQTEPPRIIDLSVNLQGGHTREISFAEDAPELRALFATLCSPDECDSLIQLPLDEGRKACTFRASQLVSVDTTPPVVMGIPGSFIAAPGVPHVGSMTQLAPYLWGLEDVLSGDECNAIIEAARPHLEPATVSVDGGVYGPAGSGVADARTNTFACFAADQQVTPEFDQVQAKLRRLVSELTQMPVEHQEHCQVLHYGEGEQFLAHMDSFTPDSEYSKWELSRGGERLSTFIVYLNEVEAGGETEFERQQVTITPAPGRAGFWFNHVGGEMYGNSLHTAHPVQKGEKWALVIWTRESAYLDTPPEQPCAAINYLDWINTTRSIATPAWIDEQTRTQQARTPHLGAGGPDGRGFEKRKMDEAIYAEILARYYALQADMIVEDNDAIGSFVDTVSVEFPAALYAEDKAFNTRVLELLKPLHEEWCGFELKPAACYGFRVYLPGSYLHNHVDRGDTHVISSTLCVASDTYSPWHLHAIDVDGKAYDVDHQPGEHVLYESALISHGRPVPLNGRYHVGMFIHYSPAEDHDLWIASPREWWERHRR